MAFRIFRLAVGAILGVLALWLIVNGALDMGTAAGYVVPVLSIMGGIVIIGVYYWALWAESRIRQVMENIFAIPELLRKLVFTLALLCIYRIGFHVPLPGVNEQALRASFGQGSGNTFGDALAYFGMFTGGSLQQSTLFGLGIMPYISAAIIFQLLATVVPSLEKLRKEGPAGQKKIQEYTRYATVVLCVIQAAVWMKVMRGGADGEGYLYPEYQGSILVFLMGIFALTAGTIFMMWLGEQIDEYGIGNGISLIIMAGITSRLPWAIERVAKDATFQLGGDGIGPEKILILAAGFVFVVAGAILITQGQRRIPIQQAKHVRGRRVMGGQRQYLPLRVNHGGVMPIIFASSLMIFPNVIFSSLQGWTDNAFVRELANAFHTNSFIYAITEIAMIFFFAYFWTSVQFRPKDMADQLRDYGSFIPGLRPGKRTAEYLERVMERITYCGAAFLAVIAVIPQVVQGQLGIDYQVSAFLGGTGLLIVVSVTLDLVQRIEANLVMRNYGGFLGGSTRIKGAYA
jgi:preprotein translocase subunit SecY